jgi:hypothetical protein
MLATVECAFPPGNLWYFVLKNAAGFDDESLKVNPRAQGVRMALFVNWHVGRKQVFDRGRE